MASHWCFEMFCVSLNYTCKILNFHHSSSKITLFNWIHFILRNCEGFEPRSHFKSRLNLIVWSERSPEQGLLSTVTDVSTTCAVVIFRVKVSCITSVDGVILWILTWLVNYVANVLYSYLCWLREKHTGPAKWNNSLKEQAAKTFKMTKITLQIPESFQGWKL